MEGSANKSESMNANPFEFTRGGSPRCEQSCYVCGGIGKIADFGKTCKKLHIHLKAE